MEEPWTSGLQAIVEEDQAFVVWWGTSIECTSAFTRLRREGILRDTDEDQARLLLECLATVWTEIQPTHEVREQTQTRATSCLDQELRQAADREGILSPVAERFWGWGLPEVNGFLPEMYALTTSNASV